MSWMEIGAISFDADGTLVDKRFADSVWFEGIPKLYSKRWGVPFEKSVETVMREYQKIGPERIEWYDLSFWFKKFSLGRGRSRLLKSYVGRAKLYPEVRGVLKELSKGHKIVIASASAREFLNLEIAKTRIRTYFHRVFSSISDFGTIGKTPEFFGRLCKSIGVAPHRLLHVGDRLNDDFKVPRKLGIRAVLLDREGKKSGKWIIHDLENVWKFLE